MMNKVMWAGAILLGLLAGLAWWSYRSLDTVLAHAVRDYGSRAAGVHVDVSSAKVQTVEGLAELRDFEVDNPAGFHTSKAFSASLVRVRLDVKSLAGDVIRIEEILIVQPKVTYEYASDGSNLDVIQRQIESFIVLSKSASTTPDPTASKKKYVINDLVIRGAQATISAKVLKGNAVTVTLDDLHIRDIGKATGGATPAEIAQQVVSAIKRDAAKAMLGSGIKGATDAVKGLFK